MRLNRDRTYASGDFLKARYKRKNPTGVEAFLWEALRGNGMGPKFRRQAPVMHYLVSFLCPRHGLIIDLAPPVPNRIKAFERGGYRVLSLSVHSVFSDGSKAVERIRSWLLEMDLFEMKKVKLVDLIEVRRRRENPTEVERLIWIEFDLRKWLLKTPIMRQFVVAKKYAVSFASPYHRIAVDLDSSEEKQKRLRELGWKVLTIATREVFRNREVALDRIGDWFQSELNVRRMKRIPSCNSENASLYRSKKGLPVKGLFDPHKFPEKTSRADRAANGDVIRYHSKREVERRDRDAELEAAIASVKRRW